LQQKLATAQEEAESREIVQPEAPPKHDLKLYYLAGVEPELLIWGRVEAIRLTLKAANVPFEDVLLNLEQFEALKPDLPHGQVPVLEVCV
jgi:hypothetical protein